MTFFSEYLQMAASEILEQYLVMFIYLILSVTVPETIRNLRETSEGKEFFQYSLGLTTKRKNSKTSLISGKL